MVREGGRALSDDFERDGEVVGRVGEELACVACMGFPLVLSIDRKQFGR